MFPRRLSVLSLCKLKDHLQSGAATQASSGGRALTLLDALVFPPTSFMKRLYCSSWLERSRMRRISSSRLRRSSSSCLRLSSSSLCCCSFHVLSCCFRNVPGKSKQPSLIRRRRTGGWFSPTRAPPFPSRLRLLLVYLEPTS